MFRFKSLLQIIMKKNLVGIALIEISLLFLNTYSFSQGEGLNTFFWNNYSNINPAITGIFQKHRATVNWRNQWDKVNGAPNTLLVGYQLKQDKISSGLGINYMYETIGFLRSNQVNFNYSHHFKLKNEGFFYVGGALGYHHGRLETSFNPINPAIPISEQSNLFIANIGFAYQKNRLLIGLSSTNLNQPKSTSYTLNRHYYTHLSYNFSLGNNFDLKPQILVRSNTQKLSIDFNILATLKKNYWIGATYRTNDAICAMIGADIKGIYRISYAYDYTLKALQNNSKGSHEIGLALLLD